MCRVVLSIVRKIRKNVERQNKIIVEIIQKIVRVEILNPVDSKAAKEVVVFQAEDFRADPEVFLVDQ